MLLAIDYAKNTWFENAEDLAQLQLISRGVFIQTVTVAYTLVANW